MTPEARDLSGYLEEVRALHLEPVFFTQPGFMPHEPRSEMVAHNWRWRDVRARLLDAARLLPVGSRGADRRVLNLLNPGVTVGIGTTHTMTASVQLVMPGELAPAHRHTPAAIRFVIEGAGAITTVDGAQVELAPGDLVLTPNWAWHDHRNDGDGPVLWLDGLDLPLVRSLQAVFYQEPSAPEERLVRLDRVDVAHVHGFIRPSMVGSTTTAHALRYEAAAAHAALCGAADQAPDPWDGIKLAYVDPVSGGPVLPTMSCSLQLLPGMQTEPRRSTTSVIYHVVSGRGRSTIADVELNWDEHDTFVVPTWSWHRHVAESSSAVLFALSDEPAVRALGLYREERISST